MSEFWKEILRIVLAPSAIIIVLTFFMKRFFENSMDHELEKFKGELNKDLENYKNELELKRFEYENKTSLIHQKNADVLDQFYNKLSKLKRFSSQLTAPLQPAGQDLNEKKKLVVTSLVKAWNYFEDNQLYFDQDIKDKAKTILDIVHTAYVGFDLSQQGSEYQPDETGQWSEAWKHINRELPPLMIDLENKFREVLGYIES